MEKWDDALWIFICMPIAVGVFAWLAFKGGLKRVGPKLKAQEKLADLMTLQKRLATQVRETKLKPAIEDLIQEAEVKLGPNIFQTDQPPTSPGFATFRSVRKIGVSISVDTLGQAEGCYSVQVNMPDETVPLVGSTIPFTARDLSRSNVIDVLIKYLS